MAPASLARRLDDARLLLHTRASVSGSEPQAAAPDDYQEGAPAVLLFDGTESGAAAYSGPEDASLSSYPSVSAAVARTLALSRSFSEVAQHFGVHDVGRRALSE